MSSIKNVTIAGASGALGSVVFKTLVDSGKFNIRVLTRSDSKATFPEGTDVVKVDYSSSDSLQSALQGQHAVISTLTTLAIDAQFAFIDAAIAAGVKRFLPSEFGSNLDNPKTRKLPVFANKVKIQNYLIDKAKSTPLTYTFVYNNAFLDWGLENGFLFSHQADKVSLFDGGDKPFNTTTLSSVGDAIVGVLQHPEETKNRAVYISDLITTQNHILELAKKAAPGRAFETINVSIDEITARSDDRLAKGLYDMETFGPYLYRALFDSAYGGQYEKTDNELLGVKGKTDDDIIELLKSALKN